MLTLTSNEKAIVGGLTAALITTIVQLEQSGQLTLHEFWYTIAAYVVTHITVWLTTNSPKPPVDGAQ